MERAPTLLSLQPERPQLLPAWPTGATPLPELHAPVPRGSHCRVYLAGGVLAKMLHPRVLKLEGTLESPGGSFKHVGRTPELLL